MTKRKTLPKVVQQGQVSPLLLTQLEQLKKQTKQFFGGERLGYKYRLINFLERIIEFGGEASAVANLRYNWWLYEEIKQQDPTFKKLVDDQYDLMVKKAEEMLYCRAMYGYEETTEECDQVIKKTKKPSDRALLEFLKAHSDKYSKPADTGNIMPEIEILKF